MMRHALLPLIALTMAAAPAPSAPARPVAMVEKTALLDFRYSWPAAAAAIPRLDARLRADARTQRRKALNLAREDRAERGTRFPFHPHALGKVWAVEGDTGRLLSLRADDDDYTGGAHGMRWYEFILWDRKAGRDITVPSLFTDRDPAMRMLTGAFCPALDRERTNRRGAPVDRGSLFGDCPDVTKQVLLPGAVRGGRFTTIRVLIAPYEAGPYSEGTYEIDLPVTTALIAQLKTDYRSQFAPTHR